MTESQTLDSRIENFLREQIPADRLDEAKEMVGRFCFTGQITIATILAAAEAADKLEGAFRVLSEIWMRHWHWQDPEMRGRPDLADNHIYLDQAYASLGLKRPGETLRPDQHA
ncbi:MAG: hypothetical protein A3A43_02340 [Candidatus Liptonbacteria bacterium RIFCSPLOWO2_01_FULL_56_20]|uniref:Uncharacterized protein n=1 Tax=Candidatus Liptonbacteria bacterium RIFCSPLOWO2_01_FULL_56_20 TaxID=1798652 RepID=A0A1G2CHE5_9BACT|nr:MAG: hypothetical protein UY96_C0002G0008 [Parcubacteria group bacterium GW2011_GWB1_56_8]OGY98289.1 MAG: hypothetical protein A2681_00500 [Candidatus Liptonbacteria bacterium RIFCSPHIGHO2_01_FULL_56_18b]OGZ00815.1 MAG: hypothetical protein A3A43_02340 [Candidatus Liptonbacteria bacterium RIFCSPLOWO2_01_FULL_56_20]